jgi:hypothetical protein
MVEVIEQQLRFVFPDGWQAEKYDDTAFYLKHFKGFANSKCVDIVAFSAEGDSLWLIEVKDYRLYPRDKQIDLFDEFAQKVRDTLANLYLAQRKSETSIHEFARLAAQKPKIRVALHLEQPNSPSRLKPLIAERTKALQKLRQAVRVADPHPWLCETSQMPPNCPWQVVPQA